jgi:hypothetical protein
MEKEDRNIVKGNRRLVSENKNKTKSKSKSESEVVPACRGAGAFFGNRALLAISSSVARVIEATRHRRRVVQPACLCV